MSPKFKFNFYIQYDSEDQAKIIYTSLIPEMQERHFDRSEASIGLKAQEIEVNVIAQDINAAKATISSLLRWISSTTQTLSTLSKHTFNSEESSTLKEEILK
jgi:tRNA threonylcarbamoyladenosine modification (KEOPS) complex  Pcc1 subunit